MWVSGWIYCVSVACAGPQKHLPSIKRTLEGSYNPNWQIRLLGGSAGFVPVMDQSERAMTAVCRTDINTIFDETSCKLHKQTEKKCLF